MDMDIEEKKYLIGKFLSADTTPEEEALLRACLVEHGISDEDKAVALLLDLESSSGTPLSDKGAREYDAILRRATLRKKRFTIASVLLAAAIAAVFFFSPIFGSRTTPASDISPLEIVQTIETLASLKPGDMEQISAKPFGEGIVIKALMKDGSTLTWILVQGDDGLSLTAMNQ